MDKQEPRLYRKAFVCDSSGAASVTISGVTGRIVAVRLILGTLASGAADVSVTESNQGATLFSVTNAAGNSIQRRRWVVQDSSNVDTSFYESILVVDATLTITVAQGGNGGAGTIQVWVE